MKNQMKKLLIAAIIALMVITQGICVWAMDEETGQTELGAEESGQAQQDAERETEKNVGELSAYMVNEIYVNPLYKQCLTEEDLKAAHSGAAFFSAEEPDETEYAETIEEAGDMIRQGMKRREETIQVLYKAPEYKDGVIKEIAKAALEHTGIPTEGDYLMWQYGGWAAEGKIRQAQDEGMCYMTFDYTYTYYTTYEEEMVVDEKISQTLSELNVYGESDYNKLNAVYDYICKNTKYDYENLENEEYKRQYTAYGALIDGKAVCQGYAVLLYRMALELGIDSRLISGTGNGGAHGWNIVDIDDVYYNLDATWDAGKSSYDYFLKGEKNFTDHVRDAEYTTEEFNEAYPMSDEDYYMAADKEVGVPVITSVYSRVQTTAKATWTPVEGAGGYELFRAEKMDAPDSEWKLIKTIKDGDTVQYTNTGLTVGTTYFYKVRAFLTDDSQGKIYSEFSNISYMPAAVKFNGPYSNSSSRIRLLWDQVDGAHGYQIWRRNDDGTFGVVKTLGNKDNVLTDNQGGTTAYSNTGLKAGQIYVYRMRAFSILDGNKVFGAFSDDISVAVMPEKTEISLASPKEGNVLITWKRMEGANGYQIWRADGASEEFSIIKSIRDENIDSYINNGLSSGGEYYYKVRAYAEINGKMVFGDFSDVQKITVK